MTALYAIGLGGQKCASSWVFDVLAAHPGINAAARKELDFFSYHHDRGHRWYEGHWQGPGVRLENSPSYLHDPRAPDRLRRFCPGARLIVTLRDPVERAYSHHLHEIAQGHIPAQPFRTALRQNPDYLEQGRYGRHLGRWFNAFDAAAILILFAEEVRAAPEEARNRLCAHLGLDPGPPPAMLAERRNVSDRPRSRLLRRTLRGGGALLRQAGLDGALAAIKRTAPAARLAAWNDRPLRATVPPLSGDERDALAAYFAGDMRVLASLLGRQDLPWESWRAGQPPRAFSRTG